MFKNGKSLVILLIVLLVLSFALAGGGGYLLQQEKQKNSALQEELDEVKTKQRITESNLLKAQDLIKNLEQSLQQTKDQLDSISKDLEQEKSARQEALTRIDQLTQDFENQKSLREKLEAKLTDAQKKSDTLEKQLKALEYSKSELEVRLSELEDSGSGNVELGKIEVKNDVKQASPAEQPKAKTKPAKKETTQSQEGKILVINKEYNFAVINLGSKDGVRIGDVYSVYRGSKLIGDIKVEKVHDSMAAAGFQQSDMKERLNEGDKVVKKTA
jgi:chromosome segregation ATPase